MIKNLIIGILLFILLALIAMIYFGRPNLMASFPLSGKEVQRVLKLTEEGNATAMTQLMIHYKIKGQLDKSLYWKNKINTLSPKPSTKPSTVY